MDVTRRESLLKEYGEVNSSFRLLTDIRFKLLAFLPIASATAAAFKGESLGIGGLGVSLFGLVVTLGLATYNTRNDQLYGELISRAASIERSLGIPDGAFSNRPRDWLTLNIGGMRWSINHGTGVSTIYAASVALWAYGVLAPIIEYLRLGYLLLNLPHFTVTAPAIMVNMSAFILAIIVTVLGAINIGKQKERRAKELRGWATKAVDTAVGLTLQDVAENKDLLSLCENLSDESSKVIAARAQFYSRMDTASIGYYIPSGSHIPSGSREVTAAHMVALLTDLPASWLYDCGTNRRGKASPNEEVQQNG